MKAEADSGPVCMLRDGGAELELEEREEGLCLTTLLFYPSNSTLLLFLSFCLMGLQICVCHACTVTAHLLTRSAYLLVLN